MKQQPNNPLHGVTLADLLERLVERYGWEELGNRIQIRCFTHDPSLKSSLKFLRKTPWARAKVERLYLRSVCYENRNVARKSRGEGGDEGQGDEG
ncbi:VF530 family protein [Stieleria sp. ICT_E10.1]|uniref:VF530 family protein n=1 Tax=Stieleria sedimenti TaxID=2976331 RepID=UPI00217F8C6E|nr:VF530 family protein [Stieleria sedimenti]MCS7471185.1 VF530 family protein [Stieleria sedimenti]